MIEKITRWSAWLYFFPRRYIDIESVKYINLESWSERFTWRQDDWNGLKDLAKPVNETVNDRRGDCEDYALVAASCLIRDEVSNVQLGFCIKLYHDFIPFPKHVIAYDGDKIYSSGSITDESPSQYKSNSEYDYIIWRTV